MAKSLTPQQKAEQAERKKAAREQRKAELKREREEQKAWDKMIARMRKLGALIEE